MKKKYNKLTGLEIETPENRKRAGAFMRWFGLRFEVMRTKWIVNFDDEAATDAALYIRDRIALTGLRITGKYKWYFLRAYHNEVLKRKKKESAAAKASVYLDDEDCAIELCAPSFDYAEFEEAVEELHGAMLAYVRSNFPPLDTALFEIYIGLQPAISYKKLAEMLRYSPSKVWIPLGKIKRALAQKFGARNAQILSLVGKR